MNKISITSKKELTDKYNEDINATQEDLDADHVKGFCTRVLINC